MRFASVLVWMALSLAFFGRRAVAEPPVFRAGAAAVDITPTEFPVIVSGGFLESSANTAHDRLMSRALVLDDGRTRVALVVVDTLMMERGLIDEARRMASGATGIPAERMMIAATHTHSAPSVMGALGSRADARYAATLPGHIARSVVLADQALRPARVGWTAVRAYDLNHCRRWIFRPDRVGRDPFGVQNVRAMMHPGHESPNHIGPAGPADPDLSLLSVQSLDGAPIAVLANLAMHYKGAPAVSADVCGRFGAALGRAIGAEAAEPAFVGILSQGTSGDSMWMDYAKPRHDPGLDGYTAAVAQRAAEAYAAIEYHAWVSLATAERDLRLGRRLPDEERLAAARETAAVVQREGRLPRNQAEVYDLEAIYLDEQPEMELRLQVIRIGELGITGFPNEVYGITGLKIKAQSPLDLTFNITLANGAAGYIPPPEQHALGGYTTWPARTAGLEVDAEPQIVATLLELLEEVSGRQRVLRAPPADAYVEAVLSSQPAAFWRMDELSGWVAEDASPGRHAGRYEPGIAFYLPGRGPGNLPFAEETPHRAVHFAGGRMTADLENPGERYSVQLWLWNGLPADARDVTGYVCAIGDRQDESVVGDHLWLAGAASGGVLTFSNGDGVELAGSRPLSFRGWHHVTLVRDGAGVSIYLDGRREPEIAGEAPMRPIAQPRWYFAGRNDRVATWEGKLDDIAVYDRPLGADAITTHYRAAGLTPPEPARLPTTAAMHSERPHQPEQLKQYAAAVAQSAPAAWWTLHESREGRLPDASGHDRIAELEDGAAARSPGTPSPNFGGGRVRAEVSELGDEYSAAMWIWNELPIASRPVTGYFFSRGPDGSADAAGEHLGIGGTHAAAGRLIVFNGNRRNELLQGNTLLPLRSWNFVVLTRQGEQIRVFLNGATEPEIDGRLVATWPQDNHELFIGARNDRFAPFAGRIDQVAIYDRVLSAEEIAAIWKAAAIAD